MTHLAPEIPAPGRLQTADESRESWWTSLVLILVVAALIRAVALFTFEGTIHDGTTRVLVAQDWLSGGRPIFGRTNWPEGNYWLPALALWIWNEPYWSVRVLFALVGLTNVWLVFQLGRDVMGRRSGAVAAWIVALMPFHVMVSAEGAMSEAPYVSFVLLALLASVRYMVQPSLWLAAGAGLALTASTLFRIDGVMWGPPIALAMAGAAYARGTRVPAILRDLAVFGVCGLLYPVGLMLTWIALYPDPFYILGQAKLNAHQFFVDGKHPRWPNWFYQTYVVAFWPASTFVLMTPVVALLGWFGLGFALRRRIRESWPLVAGVLFVSAWLAYAALKHDILAQWRYSLILVVVLAVFCLRGAEVVAGAVRGLTLPRITAVAAVVAILTQGAITYVSFVDAGALTRQLGIISPIRPQQFGSRRMLAWIDAQQSKTVVLTPHVLEQPYLGLHRAGLESSGRVVVQSYYLPRSELVHTRASLVAELKQKLSTASYVATSTSLRELGLRDVITRELVQPAPEPDGTFRWEGVHLRLVRQFGSNTVWEVLRD